MKQGVLYSTIIFWISLLSVALYYLVFYVSVDAGIAAFLPVDHQNDVVHRYAIEQARGGQASRLLIVELTGTDPDKLVIASRQLGRFLQDQNEVYQVNNGEQQLSTQEHELLFKYRYIFSPQPQDAVLSPDYLATELKKRLRELSSSLPGIDRRLVPADPTMAYRHYLQSLPVAAQPEKYQGVWFSRDHQKAILVIYLTKQGYDSYQLEKLMSAVRTELLAMKLPGAVRAVFSGPGVFAYESRRIIEQETRVFSILATVMVLSIIYVFYRSCFMMLLSALPLLVAVIVATALTHLVYSGIHGITLAFGVILLGIAIDYPIHYFSHSRVEQQPVTAVNRIWKTVLLGMVTSSIGFSAMYFSQFEGLRQLGFFSVVGLISAALSTRWLLPLFPLKNKPYLFNERLVLLPYRLLVKYRWLLVVAVSVTFLMFFARGSYDVGIDGLRQLSPVPQSVYRKDRELRGQLGMEDGNRFVLLVADSSEQVLQLTERVSDDLSNELYANKPQAVLAVTHLLPSLRTQQMRRQTLPDEKHLRARLAMAMKDLPFKPSAFDRFIRDVSLSRQLPGLDSLSFKQLLGDGVLQVQQDFLLQHADSRWYSLIKIVHLQDGSALKRFIKGKGYSNVYYLDVGDTVDALVKDFMYDIAEKSAFGLMLIMLVLLLALRSLRRMLIVLLPVLVAIASTVTILILTGNNISLFHLVSLLLVLGIGIDYGLFMTREESQSAKRDTLHSLLVCVLSTTLVFMIIGFSDILVLHAVGSTVAIGVSTSFIFSVLFALSAYKKSLLA